jgi:glycosyltransferase involved in cell wall biosynthesis
MARVASTLWAPGIDAWSDVRVIDRREHPRAAMGYLILREARRHDALVLNGAARFHELYQDLFAAMALARLRRPPAVVMAETAWDAASAKLPHPAARDGSALGAAVRAAVRALDGPHVTYLVFSRDESRHFRALFGVEESRVRVVLGSHKLWEHLDAPPPAGDYVFAGGNSLRDWPTLLEAARETEAPVRIATANALDRVPANVTAGRVAPDEFESLLAGAGVVVVPIQPAPRAAGIDVYLKAMALGKLVIVSDATAVREYVEDGRTGLVVAAGDPRALAGAIRWATDPEHRSEVDAIRRRARDHVLANHHPNDYWGALRAIADEAAERRAAQ